MAGDSRNIWQYSGAHDGRELGVLNNIPKCLVYVNIDLISRNMHTRVQKSVLNNLAKLSF